MVNHTTILPSEENQKYNTELLNKQKGTNDLRGGKRQAIRERTGGEEGLWVNMFVRF